MADTVTESPEAGQMFEAQLRPRSYTWNGAQKDTENRIMMDDSHILDSNVFLNEGVGAKEEFINLKKPAARRNAWGCMSYADLIARAIESVPDRRLTLAQIYEWMILNVPYFKDKGESNSSAGWKNSIRHNLSLHRRFTRVQNEGTGKSSWWIVNGDSKSSKTPRRRNTIAIDTDAYKKKCSRMRRKMDSNEANSTGTPESTPTKQLPFNERPLDGFAVAFSPLEFRPRASSFDTRGYSSATAHLSSTMIAPISEMEFDDTGIMYNGSATDSLSSFVWNSNNMNSDVVYTAQDGFTMCPGGGLTGLYTNTGGLLAARELDSSDSAYESGYAPDGGQLTMLQNLNENYVDCSPSSGVVVAHDGNVSFNEPSSMLLPSPPTYASALNQQQHSSSTDINAESPQPQYSSQIGNMCSNTYLNYPGTDLMPHAGCLATGPEYDNLPEYYCNSGYNFCNNHLDEIIDYQNLGVSSDFLPVPVPLITPSSVSSPLSSSSVLRQMLSQGPAVSLASFQMCSQTCVEKPAIKVKQSDPSRMTSADIINTSTISGASSFVAEQEKNNANTEPQKDSIMAKQMTTIVVAPMADRNEFDDIVKTENAHDDEDEAWEFSLELNLPSIGGPHVSENVSTMNKTES